MQLNHIDYLKKICIHNVRKKVSMLPLYGHILCQYMSIQWLGVVTNAYSMDQGKCRKMQFTSTTMCLNRKLNRQLLSAFVWGCHYPYFEIVLPICT